MTLPALLLAAIVADPSFTTTVQGCVHWPVKAEADQDKLLHDLAGACASGMVGSGEMKFAVQRNAKGYLTAAECRFNNYTVSLQFCAKDAP